jgi:hypothetical protein
MRNIVKKFIKSNEFLGTKNTSPITYVCRGVRFLCTLPEGIHLVFLPPYSLEVQPAEPVWPLSNEPLANRAFASFDELEQVKVERCRWLQAHPALIHSYTCFHWWPSSLDTS